MKVKARVGTLLLLASVVFTINLHNNASSNLDKHITNSRHEHLPPPYPYVRTQPKYLTVALGYDVNDPNHPATVAFNDAYSGSWWAPLSSFLRYKNVEITSPSQEGASFELFLANYDKVRMTKDWLDFSVEHMSKWWKQVDNNDNGPALERVVDILREYTASRRIVDYGKDAPQETLVVVAYSPYAQIELTKWSLAATIASHISVGMGRIVVSGRLSKDEELVLEAFDIVKKQFESNVPTELSFCLSFNEVANYDYASTPGNIPKAALKKLRHILLGNTSEGDIECWLGGETTINPAKKEEEEEDDDDKFEPIVQSKWKYIFFTEPDILLTTRQSSLVAMGEALKQGYVLAPHRLQPIPHGSDFNGLEIANDMSRVIPAAGAFEQVYEIDSNKMACCDAGTYKPMTEFEPYDKFWWMSGFSKTSTMPVEAAHKHLLSYPLIRLANGTQVVFVGSEQGKLCHPAPVGTC
mmetsp:Transcript_20866/g.50215  ORF Transcript_20866/g.50215 Transcript_20866/m.50215 type:complete len:468 (-) Transcript_20866:45-1448(-)